MRRAKSLGGTGKWVHVLKLEPDQFGKFSTSESISVSIRRYEIRAKLVGCDWCGDAIAITRVK